MDIEDEERGWTESFTNELYVTKQALGMISEDLLAYNIRVRLTTSMLPTIYSLFLFL